MDVEIVQDSTNCIRCGYDLKGLGTKGKCPECGTPIERSLRGDLLRYSDEQYRDTLSRGVTFIMAGVVTSLVLMIFSFVIAALGASSVNVSLVLNCLGLVGTGLGLYGYFLYSAPDPGQLGSNKGETPRRVLRAALWVAGFSSVASVPIQFFFAATNSGARTDSSNAAIFAGLLAILASLTGMVAWVVQFFAAMLYTKWLAPRIPSERILKRAKLLMWLGPVLFVFGCGIGGLVALVLYYNMFSWLRKALAQIREGIDPAESAAPAA